MSIRKGGQVIAGTPNITTGHHVGEIFWTSRLDNELNGAVDADGATYSVEAFTGEKSVPALLADGLLPSVSMAEYESIVSANGSCRAWGWDNGDTFRVPTVKALLLTKEQAAVVGNGMTLGMTNGTVNVGLANDANENRRAFVTADNYGIEVGTSNAGGEAPVGGRYGITTDPEKSGIVANLGVIEYRAMVQLSTGVKEDATQLKEYKFNNPHFFGQSMWTDVEPKNSSWLISNGNFHSGRTYGDYYKWLTDVKSGNKTVEGVSVKSVDEEYTDYDWVVNTADETFRLPLLNGSEDLIGNSRETLNLPSSGNEIIATKNGKINLIGIDSTSFRRLILNNTTNGVYENFSAPEENGTYGGISVKVKKGDVVRVEYRGYSSYAFYLSSAIGNGSLYFYVGDTLQDPALINAGGVLDYFSKLNTVHCVVETFKSGSSWYRVYDDGWIEQGGIAAPVSADGHACTVTFLKPFLDTGYVFLKTNQTTSNVTDVLFTGTYSSKTTTSIKIYNFSSYVSEASWFACGYGA